MKRKWKVVSTNCAAGGGKTKPSIGSSKGKTARLKNGRPLQTAKPTWRRIAAIM